MNNALSVYGILLSAVHLSVFLSSTDGKSSTGRNVRQAHTALSCSKGWFTFGEMCYKFGGNNKTRRLPWDQAAEACRKDYNGQLATIYSKEINDFLVAYFVLSVKENLWIGLHDRVNETIYSWVDGTPVGYLNWEPPISDKVYGTEGEDCIEMVLYSTQTGAETGQWSDVNCDIQYQFICQKEKGKLNEDYKDPRKCPPEMGGGWKKNTSCFHVIDEEKTWSDAEEYCVQNFRGHLVTITDFTISLFLDYILESEEKSMWIGIRTKNEFQQQWSSGWYVSYEKWAEGERTDEFVEGSCVARNRDGKWITQPCNKMLPFICEYSSEKPVILKPKIEGSHCPADLPDWRDLGGDVCYFFDLTNIISWHEANFLCMRRGGQLVSIHSQEEAKILQNFIKFMQKSIYYTSHFLHIGLFRQKPDEEFSWTDGSPVDFTKWGATEPSHEHEQCVEMNTNVLTWHDIHCVKWTRGYICAVPKVSLNLIDNQSSNSTIPYSPCPNCYSPSVLGGIFGCFLFVNVLIGAVVFCCCFKNSIRNYFRTLWHSNNKKHSQMYMNGDTSYATGI